MANNRHRGCGRRGVGGGEHLEEITKTIDGGLPRHKYYLTETQLDIG